MTKAAVELQGLEPDNLAEQIVSLYEQWHTGRSKWLQRVKEIIQYVFATSTRETTNVKNPWSHSTVIPKLTQIHDNLGANYAQALFAHREFFTFEPAAQDEASIGKRKAIVNYLATKHDSSGFVATMKQILNDWVQTGNGFGMVEYVRETGKDELGEEFVVYEGPKLVRISPWDIEFDPTAVSFKDTPKIIRTVMTRGELIRRSRNVEGQYYIPETVEKIKKFYNVLSGWGDTDINRNIQLQMDGFTSPAQYFRSGKVEILTFIGDIYDPVSGILHEQRVIKVIDRRYILEDRALVDLQGYGRIYHTGWRKRPDNLWAQGPLDNVVGMQYLINHLENARADGFDQILSPDRVIIGNVETERDGAVTNYYVDDAGGDVKNLAPETTVLNADNQIALKEAQMEAYTGAPREAMGIRSPGEKTAFEVSRLDNAAGRMFQVKLDDFDQEFVEEVINGELEVAREALNTADVAKVLDDDFGVTEFLSITKDDLTAKGKLKARGASHYAKRAQLVQELQSFGNVLAQDQDMKVHFPAKPRAKLWSEALNFDRFSLYKPFGQIEEQVELTEHQMAAQQQIDEFTSAGMTDADAQARAASAAEALG